MSLRLLKQYLSFRTAIAAALLCMATPAGLVKIDLFAAPPTSIEIATFREQDLIDILSGKGPIKKYYKDTKSNTEIDEILLKEGFKFYLDKENNVRQQMEESQEDSDPQVVRLIISAGSKRAKAIYVDDAQSEGDGYRVTVRRPDGSTDSIFVRIPSGASRDKIEALIRKALEDRGYTIGDDGRIYFDGTDTGDSINMIIDTYIGDGDDDSWDVEDRRSPRGPGGRRSYDIDIDGPGTWNDGGGDFDFDFDGDFGFDDGSYSPGGGGYLKFRLPGNNRIFSSGPGDIINNDKMVSDWGNYDFSVGNIQYRLQKMDIPGWFNDEWVILRKGPGDTWFLIKQDEHAALMEILSSSGNPALVEAYSKIKSKDAHEWDSGDYANVRKYDMKNPGSATGSDDGFSVDGDFSFDAGSGFGPGGINGTIYAILRDNPDISDDELQALLDKKYGPGVVVVNRDPSSGKFRFKFKEGGPNGDGSMSDWIIVRDGSRGGDGDDWGSDDLDVIMRDIGDEYNFDMDDFDYGPDGGRSSRKSRTRRGPGGGSRDEYEIETDGPGGRSSRRTTRTTTGRDDDSLENILSIYKSGKSSKSRDKDSATDRDGSSKDRKSSTDRTTTIESDKHPELERLSDGRWRLTIPIPVDSDGDGDVDYYDYEFEYLNADDVDENGKIKDSALERILGIYRSKGVDFSRVSTKTTAPGASNGSDKEGKDEQRVEVRVFKNKDEAVATMKTEKWLKFVIDQASGYYIDANGEQRALSIGINPITGTTPEQLNDAVEKLNDVKDLVNQK